MCCTFALLRQRQRIDLSAGWPARLSKAATTAALVQATSQMKTMGRWRPEITTRCKFTARLAYSSGHHPKRGKYFAIMRVPARRGRRVSEWRPNPVSNRTNGYFSDLFGGSGRVERAASALGLQGRLTDHRVHPKLKVTSSRCQRQLQHNAAQGRVRAAMLAPDGRLHRNFDTATASTTTNQSGPVSPSSTAALGSTCLLSSRVQRTPFSGTRQSSLPLAHEIRRQA